MHGHFIYKVDRPDVLTGNLYFVQQIIYLRKEDLEPRECVTWWLLAKIGDNIERVVLLTVQKPSHFNPHR